MDIVRNLLAPIISLITWLLLITGIVIQDPKYKWVQSRKFNYGAVFYYTIGIILFIIYKQEIYLLYYHLTTK